ncbi:unnamed protein product [Rotaria sp. Silwood1]|nr:unnamed protein product [Rotaria sp. Silwood1]
MYNNSFVPPDLSQNLLASNNDGAGNHQFRVYIWLDTATTYYLVVTTNKPIVTGQFTVIVTGLGSLTLSPMNASDTTNIITSQYSTVLTNASEQFCRVGDCSTAAYYYQAFTLNFSIPGYYLFKSISNIDTYGYMYKKILVPADPFENLLASNNDGAGNHQFRVYIWLDTATTYYLVVTTNKPIVTGQFTVIVTGLGSLTLSPMNASGKSQIRFRILL